VRRTVSLCAAAMQLVASACASVQTSPGGAAISRSFGRDDRIVVRAHDDVFGVAVSSRHVFARSAGGLAVYDRVFERWLEPSLSVAEALQQAGAPRARFMAITADPIEEAVWMGVPGAVLIYRPRAEQVVRVPMVGEPEIIAFARGGDGEAYVRSGGQWARVSRAGFAASLPEGPGRAALVLPTSLEEVYTRHPALRAQLPFLLRDAEGGALAARVTTAAIAPDRPSEVWVGTFGDGLWQLDANFMQARALVYGVDDEQIGALSLGADGVWSAGEGRARPFGVSFVQDGLQQFARRAHRGFGNTAGMQVHELAVRGRVAWLATDRGLWRLPLDERGAALTQWTVAQGLPDAQVLAVVPRTEGTWVGTRRGLAFVSNDEGTGGESAVVRLGFEGEPVRALALVGEQLYVGTASGLFRRDARASDAAAQRVAGVLPRPVSALAWHDSVLLVVSDRSAQLLTSTSGELVAAAGQGSAAMEFVTTESGTPVRAHVDARSIWIAGASGVLAWRRDRLLEAPRLLRAGAELPALVTDLALGETWAWVGTREGVVRVRRAAEGGLP
jgi:hypothetical protein